MPGESRRERLDKQRERQRVVRATRRAEKKPSRDDIARALLHWAIVQNLRHGREEEIAEHTGAIKSYAGTLLTRENYRSKYADQGEPK